MATGYDGQGNEVPALNLGWSAPAGQMYSTINDLMKVMVHVCYIHICMYVYKHKDLC